MNNGTNCVDWLLQRYLAQNLNTAVYDSFSDGAASVHRSGAPLFLPFVFGERCPGWNEDRAGGFVGIRLRMGVTTYYLILENIVQHASML